MICKVEFFMWVDGRVTHKTKSMKVDSPTEVWGKLRQGYSDRLISIRKMGLEDGQYKA